MDAGSEAGITLAQFAAVRAGLDAGFELEAVLRNEGVHVDVWAQAEAAWEDELDRDAEGTWTLDESFDALLAAARYRYARPIPPLDEDLGAWLDFVRIWGETEEPLTMLADLGLRASDLMYLHAHWARQLSDLPPLQQAAMAHLARAPVKLPIPRPGVATPRPPSPDALQGPRLPSAPARPTAAPSEVDASAGVLLRFEPLPEDDGGCSDAAEPQRSASEESAATTSVSDVQTSASVDEAPFGFVEYAALIAQLEVVPERREDLLGAQGLHDPARLALVEAYWQKRFEESEADRSDWERARERLVKHFRQLYRR